MNNEELKIILRRVENLEKFYIMLQDDVYKKLEMLRENNNLFATEIEKLGGFKETDDFEGLDLSPVKELNRIKEKISNEDDVIKLEPKTIIYEDFQEETLKNLKELFKPEYVKIMARDEEGNHYHYTKKTKKREDE